MTSRAFVQYLARWRTVAFSMFNCNSSKLLLFRNYSITPRFHTNSLTVKAVGCHYYFIRGLSTTPSGGDAVQEDENKKIQEVEVGGGSWREIYQGLLSTQVKLVKSFSLGTSIIGLSVQPFIINHLGSSMSLLVSFSALIGMFTFVTPALIHWFTRKYVFKLSYDPKTDLYAATTLTFFLREKTIHFRPSDVTIPEVPRMFTTFVVNRKPLFVDMETFKEIEHFGRIMGYDKPLDLRVNSEDNKL